MGQAGNIPHTKRLHSFTGIKEVINILCISFGFSQSMLSSSMNNVVPIHGL